MRGWRVRGLIPQISEVTGGYKLQTLKYECCPRGLYTIFILKENIYATHVVIMIIRRRTGYHILK